MYSNYQKDSKSRILMRLRQECSSGVIPCAGIWKSEGWDGQAACAETARQGQRAGTAEGSKRNRRSARGSAILYAGLAQEHHPDNILRLEGKTIVNQRIVHAPGVSGGISNASALAQGRR